jgi:hypothetical protein
MYSYDSRLSILGESLPEGSLDSIYEVPESMGRVMDGAERSGNPHIRTFLNAYQAVTHKVVDAYDRGNVAEPEQLASAVCEFDWLFEKQLHALVGGNEADIDLGWHPLLLNHNARRAHPTVQILIGMSPHVIGDLPPLVAGSEMNKDYHDKDYTLMVGEGIYATAMETVEAYDPLPNLILGSATRHIVNRIAVWREAAYVTGKDIKLARAMGNVKLEQALVREKDEAALNVSKFWLKIGDPSLRTISAGRRASRHIIQRYGTDEIVGSEYLPRGDEEPPTLN